MPFLLLSVGVHGETLASCTRLASSSSVTLLLEFRFKFLFEIVVHNDSEWTTVKLLPDSAAITKSAIVFNGKQQLETSTDADATESQAVIVAGGGQHSFLAKVCLHFFRLVNSHHRELASTT